MILKTVRCGASEPSILAYNSVLRSCERTGDSVRAMALIEGLNTETSSGCKLDVSSFNAAIGACAANERWADVDVLLGRMQECGIVGNEETRNMLRRRNESSQGCTPEV